MSQLQKAVSSKLPGLNGLRAIAASFVLIYHVFQIVGLFGVQEGAYLMHRFNLGGDMVNLFFVISGFIITYTLIKEKKTTGYISLKNFYIKRGLRIWPIYFLIFVLIYSIAGTNGVFEIVPDLNTESALVISFFLVNANFFFEAPLSVLGHYWSLSVEEQFYIFWPVIFKKCNPILAAWCIILVCCLIRNGADYLAFHGGDQKVWLTWWRVMYDSRFGSLAIGVIGACLLYENHNLLKVIYHPISQVIAFTLFFGSVLFPHIQIPYIESEVMATLYVAVILNVTSNQRTIIKFENKVLENLGQISFGLYMYHWPIITLLIIAFKKTALWPFLISMHLIPLIIISFLTTYIIASLSFHYFEAFFLKLKPKKVTYFVAANSKLTTLNERNYSGRW